MNKQEEAAIKPCIRSGFCCKQGPCFFGQSHHQIDSRFWTEVLEDENNLNQCIYLEIKDTGTFNERYNCGIADWIRKQPNSNISPAFGGGCCSPLNPDRKKILEERKGETRG